MTTIGHNRRFLPITSTEPTTTDSLELYESDIFYHTNTNSPPNIFKKTSKRMQRHSIKPSSVACSMPVNVPDWSKILNKAPEAITTMDDDDDEDEEDDECGVVVPPHELLARQMERTRVVCFSVHEGVGRTLKGRDLSRVRNAIWEKTGFQD